MEWSSNRGLLYIWGRGTGDEALTVWSVYVIENQLKETKGA